MKFTLIFKHPNKRDKNMYIYIFFFFFFFFFFFLLLFDTLKQVEGISRREKKKNGRRKNNSHPLSSPSPSTLPSQAFNFEP